MQMMQGAGMIGHNVLVQSNTLSIEAGKANGAIDLASNADRVNIQILSPGGQLLDTLNLGAQTTGRHTFEWDAKNYNNVGSPTFKVIATSGEQPVAVTSLAQDTVTSISTAGNTMNIELKGRSAVAYDSIQALL
jgi:flagellar basal-body rod modification protein FlgD